MELLAAVVNGLLSHWLVRKIEAWWKGRRVSHPGAGPAGHVPQPGRTPGYRIGEGTPTGEAGFINVEGRLFAPLQGLDPNDVLQGGYGWLDLTDGGRTYHPGVDLNSGGSCNADEGLPIVAVLGAVIRKVCPWDRNSSGEGNHLWYEVDDPVAPGPTWVHHDHLLSFSCREGERVVPGQVIGYCGRSGNWDCAHGHVELLPTAPADGWWQWPYGWPLERVVNSYYEPAAWWRAASAKVQGAAPPEVEMILSGAQAAAVQAVVFGDYWNPDAADHAIPSSWREEWRRGVWRGAPLASEQLVPEDAAEGKPGGSWQLFQGGAAVWLPGQPVSWNG